MKKMILLLSALMLTALMVGVSAQSAAAEAKSAASVLCRILFNLRFILTVIAAAVGALIMILQGIKWVGSADDPGARKKAKTGIVHAVVGLVIVVIAVWIVTMVITSSECSVTAIT